MYYNIKLFVCSKCHLNSCCSGDKHALVCEDILLGRGSYSLLVSEIFLYFLFSSTKTIFEILIYLVFKKNQINNTIGTFIQNEIM